MGRIRHGMATVTVDLLSDNGTLSVAVERRKALLVLACARHDLVVFLPLSSTGLTPDAVSCYAEHRACGRQRGAGLPTDTTSVGASGRSDNRPRGPLAMSARPTAFVASHRPAPAHNAASADHTPRRLKIPRGLCHALLPGAPLTACGEPADRLELWPGIGFDTIAELTHCPDCRTRLQSADHHRAAPVGEEPATINLAQAAREPGLSMHPDAILAPYPD